MGIRCGKSALEGVGARERCREWERRRAREGCGIQKSECHIYAKESSDRFVLEMAVAKLDTYRMNGRRAFDSRPPH